MSGLSNLEITQSSYYTKQRLLCCAPQVDINTLGRFFLRVKRARLMTQGIDTTTDVTEEIREYLELFASQFLLLPPTSDWKNFRPLR